MSVSYIEPQQLHALMREDGSRVSIIDVRDDDRTNWIVGSIHYPSQSHSAQGWCELANTVKGTPVVVFHCMYSQVRGPKAALHFSRMAPSGVSEVLILRGGFVNFKRMVGNHLPSTIDHPSDDDE